MRGWMKRVIELITGKKPANGAHPERVVSATHAIVMDDAKVVRLPTPLRNPDTGDLDYETPCRSMEDAGNELNARTREAKTNTRRLVRAIKSSK